MRPVEHGAYVSLRLENPMTDVSSPVDFAGLVSGLVASAATILAEVESLLRGDTDDAGSGEGESAPPSAEQRAEAVQGGLLTARHLIDTLAMLQEKTKGNLTPQEGELIQTAVTELRISYVRLADRPIPGQGGTAG